MVPKPLGAGREKHPLRLCPFRHSHPTLLFRPVRPEAGDVFQRCWFGAPARNRNRTGDITAGLSRNFPVRWSGRIVRSAVVYRRMFRHVAHQSCDPERCLLELVVSATAYVPNVAYASIVSHRADRVGKRTLSNRECHDFSVTGYCILHRGRFPA